MEKHENAEENRKAIPLANLESEETTTSRGDIPMVICQKILALARPLLLLAHF
jgi:hypothetical protein